MYRPSTLSFTRQVAISHSAPGAIPGTGRVMPSQGVVALYTAAGRADGSADAPLAVGVEEPDTAGEFEAGPAAGSSSSEPQPATSSRRAASPARRRVFISRVRAR